MKSLIIIGLAAVVGGCARTEQFEQTAEKMQELEKRVARIEGDLYTIEVKSAPKSEKKSTFAPAAKVEKKVADAKIDAFLKEYLNVTFGDDIGRFPVRPEDKDECIPLGVCRCIPVVKKFKYLDKAYGRFEDGKLYRVDFYCDIDKKYSYDSTKEKVNQAIADLAVTLGLPSDAFLKWGRTRNVTSYTCSHDQDEFHRHGCRRFGVAFTR